MFPTNDHQLCIRTCINTSIQHLAIVATNMPIVATNKHALAIVATRFMPWLIDGVDYCTSIILLSVCNGSCHAELMA